MIMNKKGFTLIELLAVIVILAVIALIAAPIILGIINDARESSNLRTIERYAGAIQTEVMAYSTLNQSVTDIKICVGDTPTTDCHVDATVAARDNGVSTANVPGTTTGEKANVVTYSGTSIACKDSGYNQNNGIVKLEECQIGGSSSKYNWDSKTGTCNFTKGAC